MVKLHRFTGDPNRAPLCGKMNPRKERYVWARDCTDDPAKVQCEACLALQAYGLKTDKK